MVPARSSRPSLIPRFVLLGLGMKLTPAASDAAVSYPALYLTWFEGEASASVVVELGPVVCLTRMVG